MKLSWWKILSIPIMIYVLIFGFKIPLKPGVVSFSPAKITTGQEVVLNVTTYNTNHLEAERVGVHLKLDSSSAITARSIEKISNNQLAATFALDSDSSTDALIGKSLSLIIDNDKDGYCIHPSAVLIKKGTTKSHTEPSEIVSLESIQASKSIRFPYRHGLNETIRNTFFHVAIWMSMFIILMASCYYSIQYLRSPDLDVDRRVESLVNVALYYGIAGIITGAMWAKYTWGTFWTADIKLNMSALSLMIYMAYWVLRRSISDPDSRARISAVYNLFSFVILMVLVMVIPRMTDSLHPGNGGNPALGGEDLDNTLRMIFYPAIIGYALMGIWFADLGYRIRRIHDKVTYG